MDIGLEECIMKTETADRSNYLRFLLAAPGANYNCCFASWPGIDHIARLLKACYMKFHSWKLANLSNWCRSARCHFLSSFYKLKPLHSPPFPVNCLDNDSTYVRLSRVYEPKYSHDNLHYIDRWPSIEPILTPDVPIIHRSTLMIMYPHRKTYDF